MKLSLWQLRNVTLRTALGIALSVSGAKLAVAQCLRENQIPVLYMAVAREGGQPSARGSVLQASQFPEAYVFCAPSHSDGRLPEVSIVQVRHDGKNVARDPNPALVSFEKLRTRGFLSYQESAVYGRIVTSQLICPGCKLEDENHRLKLRLLHEFSLWSTGRSDYREIPVSLNYHRDSKRFLIAHQGRDVHLVVHYPGRWGVQKTAVAKCRNPNLAACLSSKASSMEVEEVLDLKDFSPVKIQSDR